MADESQNKPKSETGPLLSIAPLPPVITKTKGKFQELKNDDEYELDTETEAEETSDSSDGNSSYYSDDSHQTPVSNKPLPGPSLFRPQSLPPLTSVNRFIKNVKRRTAPLKKEESVVQPVSQIRIGKPTSDGFAKKVRQRKDHDRHGMTSISNFTMFYGKIRSVISPMQEKIFNSFDMVILNAFRVDKTCPLHMLRPRQNALIARMPFERKLTDIAGDDGGGARSKGPALGVGTDIAVSFLSTFRGHKTLEQRSDEVLDIIISHFEREYDGVLIDGVLEAFDDFGQQTVEATISQVCTMFRSGQTSLSAQEHKSIVQGEKSSELTPDKESKLQKRESKSRAEARRNFLILIDCGDISLAGKDFLSMILRLRDQINGVVLLGLTINPDVQHGGRQRLTYEMKNCAQFLQDLQYECQERADFGVLALETVKSRDTVSPELPTRFQTYCQEHNFVGYLSSDPSHMDASAIHPLGGLGPNGVLDSDETQAFLRQMDSVTDAPFGSDRYHKFVRAMGYRLADAARLIEFDPAHGDCPTVLEIRELIDTLKTAFVHQLGKISAEDGGQQMTWGTEAHAAWLSVCSSAFSRLRDAEDQPHALADVSAIFSQLEKRALERADKDMTEKGEIVEDDDLSDDDDDEFKAAVAEQEKKEKEKARSDVLAYDTAGKLFASISRPRSSTTTTKEIKKPDAEKHGKQNEGSSMSGQKEFGFRHRLSQYAHIVQLQHDLRLGKLLGNVSQKVKREIYHANSTSKNELSELPDDRFTECINRLTEVITAGPSSAKNAHIFHGFKLQAREQRAPLFAQLQTLLELLQSPSEFNPNYMKVHLWESDPGGLKFVAMDGQEQRWEAVSEKHEGVLHVYIQKRHANFVEAVIHQYLQSTGMSNTACVLAEAVCRTHEKRVGKHEILGAGGQAKDEAQDGMQTLSCVSDRMLKQIENASVRELMGFVQRTRKQELILVRRKDLSVNMRELALRVAKEIGAAAHGRLLEVSKHNADNKAEISMLSKPLVVPPRSEALRYDLATMIREAAWQHKRMSQFQSVLMGLNVATEMFKTSCNAHKAMRDCIMTYGRDAGLCQLELMIRDVTPFIVNEVDLCTVYVEMGGMTDGDVHRLFNLSKHDIGKVLYTRIRKHMISEEQSLIMKKKRLNAMGEEDDTIDIEGGPPPNPYEDPTDVVLGNREYIKKFLDGLFFMFPFFINLLLVLTLKTGVFTSTYMSQSHQNMSGIAIVVAFVSVGGLNSCIAKTGSYYLYQWSFAVMLVILTKLLWAGLFIVAFNGLIVGIISLYFYTLNDALVLFGYTILFGLLQLLIACLYNSHKGSIWKSKEGIAIIISIVIATVLVLMLLFLAQVPAIAAHFISLGAAVFFMLCVYLWLVHSGSVLYDNVASSSDQAVMEWYHDEIGGPSAPPNKKIQDEQDAALIKWLAQERGLREDDSQCKKSIFLLTAKKEAVRNLREARAAFAVSVMQARSLMKKAKSTLVNVDPLVMKRAQNYIAEESLVHWYVLLSAKTRPFPCTSEWDVVLKEAQKAMGIKTRTDILNRGGILWDMCRAYAVHGSFYFALMFVDRVLRVFGGSGSAFFVPTTPYELGIGWAQVFLLLAVGSLEPLVYRKARALENCEHLRVGEKVSLGRMLRSRGKQHRTVYIRELWICCKFSFLAQIVALGFLFFFAADAFDWDVLWIYIAACLGYIGFLIGGFNMYVFLELLIKREMCSILPMTVFLLFLSGQQHTASSAIVRGLIAGLFSGGVCMLLARAMEIDFAEWGLPQTTFLDLSVVGILVGGLTYGYYSVPRPGKHDKMSPTYDFASKAPLMTTAMQTSGQKYIQAPSAAPENSLDPGEIQARERYDAGMIALTERLAHMRSVVRISGETGAGLEATNIITNAIHRFRKQPQTSLIRRAFPDGDKEMQMMMDRWNDGETELCVVNEKYLILPGGEGDNVFSAVSRMHETGIEDKPPILQIWVGIDTSRPPQSQSQNIVESLIHETYEQTFKMGHAYAVAAELLIQKDYQSVPARIMDELHVTVDKHLFNIDETTDDEILQHALINLGKNAIDHQWTKLNDRTKELVAGLLKTISPNFVSEALTPAQLRAHLHMSARNYRTAVSQLTGDPPRKELWDRRLALAQISCRLACAIKHACRDVLNQRHVQRSVKHRNIHFKAPASNDWDPYDTKGGRAELSRKRRNLDRLSWTDRFKQRMDTLFRLYAMAVTGDPSFHAERFYSSNVPIREGGLGWLLSFFLFTVGSLIHIVSINVVETLVWLPLRLFRPQVRILYEQLESGLNRTRVFRNTGLIDHIVRQDPENLQTGFLQYPISNTQEDTLNARAHEVIVFSGSHDKEPNNLKQRVAVCEYKGGRIDRRLETKGPNVEKTFCYSYSATSQQTLRNFFIPVEKRVYKGNMEDEDHAQFGDIQEIIYYDDDGRAVAADIMRKDPSGRVWKINAAFEHPVKTNAADTRACRHIYKIEGNELTEDLDENSFSGTDMAKPFYKIIVTYHDFTSFVSEVEFRRTERSDPLVTKYVYKHVSHPTLETCVITAKGKRKHETPLAVVDDQYQLLMMKPATSIYEENLLVMLPKQKVKQGVNWFQKLFGLGEMKTEYIYTSQYSTSKARTVLWGSWQAGNLEGVYAQMFDERILRKQKVLKPYWRLRAMGAVKMARKYIVKHEGKLGPLIGFPKSNISHLIIRVPDLLAFGPGGSSHHNGTLTEIAPKPKQEEDDVASDSESDDEGSDYDYETDSVSSDLVEDVDMDDDLDDDFENAAVVEAHEALRFTPQQPLHLLGVDSGTWPADGGGVASCRRDVINRLENCRWMEIAEIGSPMKLVQGSYQIEQNVQSLTFVPLWGTEIGGPNQTVLSNISYGKLSAKRWRTTDKAIVRYFIPILTQQMIGMQLANATVLKERTPFELDHATALFVNLHLYFQRYDWSVTWEHPLVHEAWRNAWLHIMSERLKLHKKAKDTPGVDAQEFRTMQRELPTLEDIDFSLSLIMHFLMPITVPLKPVPVVHASHHGIQAVIGSIARQLNNSAFMVWDHGVLWRERVLALAELKTFPLFVRNVLVGITRVCVAVVFHNTDFVVPCCSTNNPEWEARLGGHNNNQQETDMWRRISPVINGMETDRFHVHREQEIDAPSAVMLSHVYDLKDVKNAIRAADIIVNKFKIPQYKLTIYGSVDKDLEYTDDCKAIIADNGLANNVTLKGLGNAPAVLPHAWIFLNSSKSEGLPLALGEAGLAGLPVVCTDVGGSREVVTDDGQMCGHVSPARNSHALAEAQIRVMAMLGNLEKAGLSSKQIEDGYEPKELSLSDFQPIKPDGPLLIDRMMQMRDCRQRLGMKFRAYILRAFTMKRYLREHEQLMWIAAMRSRERRAAQVAIDRGDVAIDIGGGGEKAEKEDEKEQGGRSRSGSVGGKGRRNSVSGRRSSVSSSRKSSDLSAVSGDDKDSKKKMGSRARLNSKLAEIKLPLLH